MRFCYQQRFSGILLTLFCAILCQSLSSWATMQNGLRKSWNEAKPDNKFGNGQTIHRINSGIFLENGESEEYVVKKFSLHGFRRLLHRHLFPRRNMIDGKSYREAINERYPSIQRKVLKKMCTQLKLSKHRKRSSGSLDVKVVLQQNSKLVPFLHEIYDNKGRKFYMSKENLNTLMFTRGGKGAEHLYYIHNLGKQGLILSVQQTGLRPEYSPFSLVYTFPPKDREKIRTAASYSNLQNIMDKIAGGRQNYSEGALAEYDTILDEIRLLPCTIGWIPWTMESSVDMLYSENHYENHDGVESETHPEAEFDWSLTRIGYYNGRQRSRSCPQFKYF